FTSSFHRYNMVKIAVSDNSFFDVSDIEIKKKSPSYTYITVKKMKKMYNNYNIFFIIGQDSLLDLPNWYNANKLIKEVDFIVAKRTIDFKYEKNENFPVNFKLSNSPIIGISSTYIRTCIKERKSIKYLLPEKVRMYIKKENIYG
ncbi:MAG TPA: nicotinate (nicotinamide) nucleotide adenylyltransferase, partial [Candidatus Ratteibacteria bacterium]|nr:nicotinate (nicotinamide) nucleotide adenylyltransferase [Candidatus Ratteibacteria bacterium]